MLIKMKSGRILAGPDFQAEPNQTIEVSDKAGAEIVASGAADEVGPGDELVEAKPAKGKGKPETATAKKGKGENAATRDGKPEA